MPAYDSGHNPPAPVVEVAVGHPVAIARREVLAGILDTGADVTVIPAALVAALGLQPKGRCWTRGFDGTFSRRPIYYARLDLAGLAIPTARCVASDRATVLLGRNVLNRFVITLDGPNLTFEMRAP